MGLRSESLGRASDRGCPVLKLPNDEGEDSIVPKDLERRRREATEGFWRVFSLSFDVMQARVPLVSESTMLWRSISSFISRRSSVLNLDIIELANSIFVSNWSRINNRTTSEKRPNKKYLGREMKLKSINRRTKIGPFHKFKVHWLTQGNEWLKKQKKWHKLLREEKTSRFEHSATTIEIFGLDHKYEPPPKKKKRKRERGKGEEYFRQHEWKKTRKLRLCSSCSDQVSYNNREVEKFQKEVWRKVWRGYRANTTISKQRHVHHTASRVDLSLLRCWIYLSFRALFVNSIQIHAITVKDRNAYTCTQII